MQGNPRQSWILDSARWIPNFIYMYWSPDFLSVELGFGIPDSLSWIPDSTIFQIPQFPRFGKTDYLKWGKRAHLSVASWIVLMSYFRRRQLLQSRRKRPQIPAIKNYMETTFNDYSWQGNRGAKGKQGLPGDPGAQVRQNSDFYLTRPIGHSWLGWVLLSINRCIIFLQGQIGPRGENGEFGLTGEMVSSRKSLPYTFWSCFPYFIKNVLQIDSLRYTSHWFVTSLYMRYGKTGSKNEQFVSQHCCKLSWKAMLRVYQPRIKPVLQQISWLLQVSKCQYCLFSLPLCYVIWWFHSSTKPRQRGFIWLP